MRNIYMIVAGIKRELGDLVKNENISWRIIEDDRCENDGERKGQSEGNDGSSEGDSGVA